MPMNLKRRRCCNESVDEMEPQNGRFNDGAPYLVGNCLSLCLSVNLSYHHGILSHFRVDHDKSCWCRTANGCFLHAELSRWNEFLWAINFELREASPCRRALVGFRGGTIPVVSKLQRRHSFALVHWLPMKYRSMVFVELCELGIEQDRFLIRECLRLSRDTVHGKQCNSLLYDCLTRDLNDALRSTATAVDMLQIMSMRFSSVRVPML